MDRRATVWRNHRPKNRMREICTSGSVRGLGGNAQVYSARRKEENLTAEDAEDTEKG